MEWRKLKDLTVSEIGMGCMGFSHGYGEIPSETYAIEAIRDAYHFGCNFFDTAEAYGPYLDPKNRGHNERIVGKALKDVRKDVILATKLHIATQEPAEDGSVYRTLRRHIEASLERLQTDYVDLYYLHRVNPEIPVEDGAADPRWSHPRLGHVHGQCAPVGTCTADHPFIRRAKHLLHDGPGL